MSSLIYVSIPLFFVTMWLESVWARRARARGAAIRGYERRDTAASLAMGVGNVAISFVTKVGSLAVMSFLYEYRVATLPASAWWSWLLLFFAEDFCYYWFHRASHEVRFLWAAHVNHHSSRHYNLSTALRQSWTTPFTAPPFWWVLPLVGFDPLAILTQQAISLLYQYWIHTESIRTLGPLEWVFNTPSHHRVHHGKNPEYLDKNHGGILIVWDRLFGTFAPERAPVVYGLTKDIDTFHPVRIAFHEWRAVLGAAWRAPSPERALACLVASPAEAAAEAAATGEAAPHEPARDDAAPPALGAA